MSGKWRLPLYNIPTQIGMPLNGFKEIEHYYDAQLTIRVGIQGDPIFDEEPSNDSKPYHYKLPQVHDFVPVQKQQTIN